MGLNKAFDRSLFTLGGALKTSGGAMNLAKGQLAIVDQSQSTVDGALVLSSFLGRPKNAKNLAIRLGGSNRLPNRSWSNKGFSSTEFALNEVRDLRVSVPKRTTQSVDEVTLGYDGFNASSAFDFRKGGSNFNVSMKIRNGLLQYRGGGEEDIEIVNVNFELPKCDPFNECIDCDECEAIDCQAITMDIIERMRRKQVAGGFLIEDFVEITPIFSCDQPQDVDLIPYVYYTLEVCDTGDDNALALISSQYEVPVIKINRRGSNTTYQMLIPETDGVPDPYEQTVASIIKGCAECPEGYDPVVGGFVYAITIEDAGVDRSSVITAALANAKYVANTVRRAEGNNQGVGFYTAVYSSMITAAEVTAFTNTSTNARNTATVAFVNTVADMCANDAVTEIDWVEGDTCNAIEETYTIVLPDNECGEDRLEELQARYPYLTIAIADSVNSTRTITLTGTSGTANINVGGTNYLATFAASLTTTAANFVTAHAATILATEGVTVTANAGVLTFSGLTADMTGLTITNATTNLAGTLGTVTAIPARQGCSTMYTTTVISNLVCDECDPIYLDFFVTKAPESFAEIMWELVPTPGLLPTGNCLCGIRFKGKTFYLEGDEALRESVGFIETSTQIQVSAGFPTEIREGIGYIEKGVYSGKYRSRWEPRTHLSGNLEALERESRAYFLNENYRHSYLGRVLRGEESVLQEALVQNVQYTVAIEHAGHTQGFGRQNVQSREYHIFAEIGRHQAIEDILNDLAANAGIAGVQAFA